MAANEGVMSDWLSSLPDEVLHRILSMLPLKDAVRTSVLSKRWERLWESVTTMSVNETRFSHRLQFMDFVDRALLLRDSSPLEKFSMLCSVGHDVARINQWIDLVADCGVQELSLLFTKVQRQHVLPRGLFESEKLVKLLLQTKCILRAPPSVNLPCLKDMTLSFLIFEDEESTRKLFSLPTLEKLCLYRCNWTHLQAVSISAPKLQKLSIHEGEYHERYDRRGRVVIDAPCLKSFSYRGKFIDKYVMSDSPGLVEADVRFLDFWPDERNGNMCLLFRGLRAVKSLTLDAPFLSDPAHEDYFHRTFPVLGNATALNFGDKIDIKLLPELNVLEDREVSRVVNRMRSYQMPHLKKIFVRHFKPTKSDLRIAILLLGVSDVLEEIVLHYAEPHRNELSVRANDLLLHLMELPRDPKHCKVHLIL
ncbi:hypothetical protein CRG98_041526 [Punica granatum]|uniref:F-box domain-containing protein n=1 Tax=Punica granatum TaxID=22663 RepID=A0A2I0I274_PUNGR|nr:hypothetical protein CRG98_041526 [Punica granatum]